MHKHVPAVIAGLIAGCVPAGYAIYHKPKPVVLQPQTTVISMKNQDRVGATPTLSDQRKAASMWGALDQKEVDAIADKLKTISKSQVVIFCQSETKCGDMGLDFENAFETAHWDVRQEAPLVDDTIGLATSRADLRDAINEATGNRLSVKIIAKNAPYDVLAIGRKR